ncbi:MAG: Hsp20 family protein [Alphaproteobacteria bacterium]|nr:Hsp20 family protein [Alphaproteobacteria bacterium]
MQTFDFSPFYRSTVGFDRLFDRLDSLTSQEAKTYPPYNIERLADDAWRVSVAVAGFSKGDISVEAADNLLTIKGGKAALTETEERTFLHRGIAERSFELRFQLGDHVEVRNADLEHGLLHLELKREVPENKKPRQIAINSGNADAIIEDKSVN